MNTLTLIIGILLTVAFVLYTKKVATKTFSKKSNAVLATVVAPIAILFLAIYTTAYSVVRIAMISNPEILTDTVKKLEENEKKKQMEAAKDALKNISAEDSKNAPIIGNPDGKVVIYEFYDYNCGFCKRGHAALTDVLKDEKDVKVVLKSFPIFPPSQIPGRAIIAAQMQGKAEALHNELFSTNLIPEHNDKASEKMLMNKSKLLYSVLLKRLDLMLIN
ncbi:MAG: DsbA family protein [Alphaproteobacteria bacterium]|nr:DsbA family protein [Alphaproteobacteria bacterium]